jgi:spore coat protein CotH
MPDGCEIQPRVNQFTYYPATVTIDGETVENVGLRKKGFFEEFREQPKKGPAAPEKQQAP